ncbi:unnamed protein product [Blepharisma stoltei]|uniref:Uncharacterized protein n=1 Tax=Blepharisma stoltei TaxID=1481888 RepID=A0AAU9IS91_9CILI|nr:unnamed protein product [Blepharisma stoltei]
MIMKKIALLLLISLYIEAYSIRLPSRHKNKCQTDLDCPVLDCLTYPCDTFVCENRKCVVRSTKEICVIGGCSGQLCVSYYENGSSTCEWKPVYGCYSEYGNCSLIDGKCQWEPTEELKACINDRGQAKLEY